MQRSTVLAGLCVLALAIGLGFFDLGHYPLWDPDEARHSEIAREMVHAAGLRHLWIPTLEFQPYREKPAPYYWLASATYGLLGESETSARLPSSMMALVTVVAVYAHAARRLGVVGGLAAGLVLVTQVGWFWLARLGTLDMTFTTWVTLSVLAGLAWLERPAPRRPPWLAYITLGAATLIKGPLALGLVGAPLLAAAWLTDPRPRWGEVGAVRGALLVAGIAAVFYLPAAILDPGYVGHFAHTHLRRLEGTAPHHEPVWFYAAWLPVLALPWTAVLIPAAIGAARHPRERVWLGWAVAVPGMMSIVSSKLPTYLLPALPPIALLVGAYAGRWVTDDSTAAERTGAVVATWTTALGFVVGAVSAWLVRPAYPVGAARAAVSLILAVAAALLVWMARGGRLRRVPAVIALAAIAIHLASVRLLAPTVSRLHSDAALAAAMAGYPDAPVIAFDTQAASLAFYRRRPAGHTGDPAELGRLAAGSQPLFVVVGSRRSADVEAALGTRAHLWITTPRRRLYATIPAPTGTAGTP